MLLSFTLLGLSATASKIVVSSAISLFVGIFIGALFTEKEAYDRGCQDTHDYYRARYRH